MPIRLFISHSSQDITFVEGLVELLRAAIELRQEEIRCTSLDGYRLPGGAHTDAQLQEEVMAADVCLGVISPRALESLYVAFELGARWGARRPLIPILAPGVQPDVLRGPLGGINALQCTRPQLHQLVDDVARQLSRTPSSPAAYDRYIDRLLDESVNATDAASAGSSLSATAKGQLDDLVLFFSLRLGPVFVRSQRIEMGEQRDPWLADPSNIMLEVVPDEAQGAAGLRALRQAGGGIGVAYGDDAYLGSVTEARQLREGGKERWRVVFVPERSPHGSFISEVATEGYSADDIAELRARRILLNEDLPGSHRRRVSALGGLVRGMSTPLPVERSPFPMVREMVGAADAPLLLTACRLFGVLYLKLSGTVEHVWQLDLALKDPDTLRVDFEGQRRRVYENADPRVIRVEGTCSLSAGA